jgi:paraquat-inducible protein B
MSNIAKKYIWSFFNPAAGRTAIVTDEKDVAKAVEIYKELGYKNIDKIEFISEAYAGEKDIEQRLQQAQAKIDELEQSFNSTAEVAEQFMKDKHFYMDELKKAEAKIEQYEKARQSYLQACDELEAHADQPDIVLSIVSELRQALEGTE